MNTYGDVPCRTTYHKMKPNDLCLNTHGCLTSDQRECVLFVNILSNRTSPKTSLTNYSPSSWSRFVRTPPINGVESQSRFYYRFGYGSTSNPSWRERIFDDWRCIPKTCSIAKQNPIMLFGLDGVRWLWPNALHGVGVCHAVAWRWWLFCEPRATMKDVCHWSWTDFRRRRRRRRRRLACCARGDAGRSLYIN